jgi:hypothetical protein
MPLPACHRLVYRTPPYPLPDCHPSAPALRALLFVVRGAVWTWRSAHRICLENVRATAHARVVIGRCVLDVTHGALRLCVPCSESQRLFDHDGTEDSAKSEKSSKKILTAAVRPPFACATDNPHPPLVRHPSVFGCSHCVTSLGCCC